MTIRENVILAYQHKQTLWSPNFHTDIDCCLQSSVNERYEGTEKGTDEFGVEYTYVPTSHAPIVSPDKIVLDDITKWKEKVKFPNVENYDWVAGARRDTANWDRINKFSIVMMFNGPFERLHALMGFENALMAVIDEPECAYEFFKAFNEYRAKLIQKIAKYYKPDSVMVFDDYGGAQSMLISPSIWRGLLKPNIKTLVDFTHECGLYYTLHCCGYMKPIFGDFVEIGVDAVQPLQFCNDVPDLKAKYGKQITFCGGFDNTHLLDRPNVTPEEIRAEVRRGMREIGVGGSFVAWPVIFSRESQKIFSDEVLKDSIPKMKVAGVDPATAKFVAF
jgi:hypothetical protein